MSDSTEFIAVVKEVKAKALVSLDKSFRITLDSEDAATMQIGTWPADETVKVKIERMCK